MTRDEVQLHLQYSAWAAGMLLAAAASLPDGEASKDRGVSHHSIEETLAHCFQADRVWPSRVTGAPPHGMRMVGEVPHTLAFLQSAWPVVEDGWQRWAASVDDFAAECSYRNLKGDPFRTPYSQIVMHVVNHASIHAGQVMAMLRQAGAAPPQVDLIAFYRERLAAPG
ncbi:MAG: DinB family protein [Bryobacteraceae bacterium]